MSNSDDRHPEITAEQCRAARALLGISQEDLTRLAEIQRATLSDFEQGNRAPQRRTLLAIRRALELAGVEFIAENGGGPGVRLKNAQSVQG